MSPYFLGRPFCLFIVYPFLITSQFRLTKLPVTIERSLALLASLTYDCFPAFPSLASILWECPTTTPRLTDEISALESTLWECPIIPPRVASEISAFAGFGVGKASTAALNATSPNMVVETFIFIGDWYWNTLALRRLGRIGKANLQDGVGLLFVLQEMDIWQ